MSKANKFKGSGRPGAAVHYVTVQTKKAAEFCGDKMYMTYAYNTQYNINTHNGIMSKVTEGKYTGTDKHYIKQNEYYKKNLNN